MFVTWPILPRPRSLVWAGSLFILFLAGAVQSAECRVQSEECSVQKAEGPLLFATRPATFAEGWSIKGLFTGVHSRARVVQVCIVCMCLGLFILMKKFTP